MTVKNRLKDGGASSIEWALLTPVLILVILFAVQFAMLYHAEHIALAAAQSGARTARQADTGNWRTQGSAAAKQSVNALGPTVLKNVTVKPAGDGSYSRGVTVTGTAVQVVPGMTFNVSKTSEGPVECFRPDVNGAKKCAP